jgi:hypothetical protein
MSRLTIGALRWVVAQSRCRVAPADSSEPGRHNFVTNNTDWTEQTCS